MSNPFVELRSLFPAERIVVCEVVDEHADGTSLVRTKTGQKMVVAGTGNRAPGGNVLVKGGVIQGDAPDLPLTEYEI